jgi:glycosyltransferase involved in cell wall biosynthesis
MKVLHIIPSIAPVRGGPGQAILELVRSLQLQGIDAEIATTNDNGADLLEVPLCQRIDYQRVPVWFFPRFSPPIQNIREFTFSSEFTSWLWQHITNYQLVHVHGLFSYTSTAAMAIAQRKKIPYIIRPNGMLCNWSLQQSALKKKIYLALTERANLNRSWAIEFTAIQEQEEASPLHLKAESFVLPYGLYLPKPIPDARQRLRQLLKVPEDEPIILFMSRLHYKKGLDYLIPTLGKIADRRFTFVLAGSGSLEYEAEIDTLLQTANIRDRTYVAGFVEGEQKNLFLQGSDIFALTSHSESFGLAVLEAIAAGLFVVTTPGVPLAPVVEQYELGQVPELNVTAIALALKQCLEGLNDCQKTEARHKRANQLVLEQYTWDSIATKLVGIYASMTDKYSTPLGRL